MQLLIIMIIALIIISIIIIIITCDLIHRWYIPTESSHGAYSVIRASVVAAVNAVPVFTLIAQVSKRQQVDSKPDPLDRQSDALTAEPPRATILR